MLLKCKKIRKLDHTKTGLFNKVIIVDHPFTDRNKRTAMYFAIEFAHQYKKKIGKELLINQIISIAKIEESLKRKL